MVKTITKKDEGSDKDAKTIQAQTKEIANLKAELKKSSELESKLKAAESALSESNRTRDGLRSKCKELEEELKKAKKAVSEDRTNVDSEGKPESAHTIHNKNEGGDDDS